MTNNSSIFNRPMSDLIKENMKINKDKTVIDNSPLIEFPDSITDKELEENIKKLENNDKEN